MKKLVHRFPALALIAFFAGPLLAQTSVPSESNVPQALDSASKIRVSVSRNESPELVAERSRLEFFIRRHEADGPDAAITRSKIAQMERGEQWFLTIDFPGGNLRALLDALPHEAGAFSFNVISAGDARDVDAALPPFSLRNASLETLFGVVKQLIESKGFNLTDTDAASRRIINSVVCVLSRRDVPQAVKRIEPTLFDSFPLGAYLNDQSIDDIVGAIRAGWELNPAHDRDALRLKFHPPTAILLVSGPPDAIAVANKVISQLKGAFDKDSKSELRSRQNQLSPPETTK